MKIQENNYLMELRQGNQKALGYIIDRYGGLVLSIIRKTLYLMPDRHEECFDDIFLIAWNHCDRYDETQTSFKNWIAAIARNKSIDYLRKYRRELELLSLEASNTDIAKYETIPLLDDEISSETQKILACLSLQEQELLMKIYMEDVSISSLSQDMGVNETTLYKRVSRSKQKIRNLFSERRKSYEP